MSLEYPLKDLYRRRLNTLAALTGLALSVASIVFLLLVGASLSLDLGSLVWRTSLGIRHMISSFLILAIVLSLTTGLLILVNVSFTLTEQRQRDIGVMKAIGLAGELGSFFVAEALLITLAGCSLGVLIGLASYVGCVRLMLSLGHVLPYVLPTTIIVGAFAVSSLVAFALSYFPLHLTFSGLKAVDAISTGLSSRRVGAGGWLEPLSRLGFSSKMAVRSLGTRGKESLRTMASVALCMVLVSILVFGGLTLRYTTIDHVGRGVGEDVLMISHPEVGDRYVKRLTSPKSEGPQVAFEYVRDEYTIVGSLVQWIENHPAVKRVDPRIVTESRVFEVMYVKPIPGPAYVTIGDDRWTDAVIMGVRPETMVNSPVIEGRFWEEGDGDVAVIGDSLLGVVYDPSVQKIRVSGRSYDIVGVCVDPMNMGYTVYLPYHTLSAVLGTSEPNVVFVKVIGDKKEEALASIGSKAAELGLRVYDLSYALDRSVDFVQALWSSISILPSLALGSTALSLSNHLLITTTGRISDLRVMRGVGARWGRIRGVILAEVLIIVLLGGPPGVVIGLTVSSTILTPYSTPPPLGVMISSIGILLGALAVLCGISLISAEKVLKKQIMSVA